MREWLRFHSPTVGAFLALCVVAGALSLAMPVPSAALESGSPLPAEAIPLPGPGEDADGDSYADGVDVLDGDLQVGLRLLELRVPGGDAEPYVLVGTQDDHWRTGEGAELAWRHIVDPDSLGRKPGSPAWQDSVIRTGQWWLTRPGDGLDLALAETGTLGPAAPAGTHWPQTVWANVRDDRAVVTLDVELRDASTRPHSLRGSWHVEIDVTGGQARVDGDAWLPFVGDLRLEDGSSSLLVHPLVSGGIPHETAQAIAGRWAPTLRFDSEESFVPVSGDLLEAYFGFTRLAPANEDLRTWDLDFNSARDGYRLFLADFNGDGDADHLDAQAMADVLVCGLVDEHPCREGDRGAPTVYANVAVATDDQVVVQYWFLYFYNFVLDDAGTDIDTLQHKGDREFVQLTFPDLEAARNGTPSAIAFSQHYAGLLVEDPTADAAPLEGGRLVVQVARGSHANYPAPGDDKRLRSSLTALFDRFDGEGRTLSPGNYTLELLGGQSWHAGYKWGPVTRYTRDLGTSSQPFLQHDFRFPFTDPIWWQASLERATPDELEGMYGSPA